jgi:uncharacterized protein YecE (DUF72 family)
VPKRSPVTGEVRIGTSGWQYRHWRGAFYPADLPHDRWFAWYAERFDTVELNATFYRLPGRPTWEAWRRKAPDGFRFAAKASRYMTHVRRLREPAEPLERIWDGARRLGEHRGPVLYQLPPRWRPNVERLAAFLDAVPADPGQAIEIRDARWYVEDILGLLERRGMSLCFHDMVGSVPPFRITGPIVYVRFHGPDGTYSGRYSDATLDAWAERIGGWADAGRPVWAYFNNDIGGHAVVDAERLRDRVMRRR